MKVKDLLINARKLIENKENWIRGLLAADVNNIPVKPENYKACKFCALGALGRVCPTNFEIQSKAIDILSNVARKLYKTESITCVNDSLGHQAVLNLFDEAIKNCN